MLAKKSPAMRIATLRLKELSAGEEARMLHDAWLKQKRDNYAREQGAVVAAKYEIASAMLRDKEPIEKIIKYTDLTHEEITNLQNGAVEKH
ncbi:MAG: hypothetical protein FWC20_11340 [Oscillospiraceae bacterium]|nr:hypothetical protein [Oscillospiraceae bacterium]MCL2279980.1 hypothetical protein [Oscillospiraceae bacterium]